MEYGFAKVDYRFKSLRENKEITKIKCYTRKILWNYSTIHNNDLNSKVYGTKIPVHIKILSNI